MIIFNLYAVLQGVIGFLVIALLHFFLKAFGVRFDFTNGNEAMLYNYVIVAFVAAATDALGIKGRLFWLPTWIVLLVVINLGPIVVYDEINSLADLTLIYGSTSGIVIFYFWLDSLVLKKYWKEQRVLLSKFIGQVENGSLNKRLFWKAMARLYYYPSFVYMRFNGFWQLLYSNAVPADELLDYYRQLVNCINVDDIEYELHKTFVNDLRENLNQADRFNNYIHPKNGFTNLGFVIELINKNIKEDDTKWSV